MNTISISEVISEIRKGNHVNRIVLKDSSRYIANSKGEMSWATTLVEKKYADRQKGDEIVKVDNKEVNITELTRIMNVMRGKGNAHIIIGQRMFFGEIID